MFSTKRAFFIFLLLLSLVFVILSALFFSSLPLLFQTPPPQAKTGPIDDDSSVVFSGKKSSPPQIPADQTLLIEQPQALSLISTSNEHITTLSTPGYSYNLSVPPVLLPSGQLIYSGVHTLWLTNIFHSTLQKIAAISADQVFTSLVASDDGSMIAWSSAPSYGKGSVSIYAGSLEHTTLVYQQSAARCPCFRAFSFLHATNLQSQPALLLSDDRGDHDPVYYGIWLLDLTKGPSAQPQPLLTDNSLQGPLALSPTSNTLLYAPVKGFVPAPTDDSVPAELGDQAYANSLSLLALNPPFVHVSSVQEVVARQRPRSNSAEYHWITTPGISPDGHTLIYVLFSSDSSQPYARHNALYLARFADASKQSASQPQLLASSSADFMELGPWLNEHLLTFYADGGIYMLDTQTNGLAKLTTVSGDYTRIIAVVR